MARTRHRGKNTTLFEIEGVARTNKKRTKIYRSDVAAFDKHLFIELNGDEEHLETKDIFNLYFQESITDGIDSPYKMAWHHPWRKQC